MTTFSRERDAPVTGRSVTEATATTLVRLDRVISHDSPRPRVRAAYRQDHRSLDRVAPTPLGAVAPRLPDLEGGAASVGMSGFGRRLPRALRGGLVLWVVLDLAVGELAVLRAADRPAAEGVGVLGIARGYADDAAVEQPTALRARWSDAHQADVRAHTHTIGAVLARLLRHSARGTSVVAGAGPETRLLRSR